MFYIGGHEDNLIHDDTNFFGEINMGIQPLEGLLVLAITSINQCSPSNSAVSSLLKLTFSFVIKKKCDYRFFSVIIFCAGKCLCRGIHFQG